MPTQASIAEAVNGVAAHFRAHPESGRSNDAPATATLQGGLRFQVTHPNGMTVATDMPAAFGGEATAPSPGWLMRAASAACNASMIAIRAAQEGITLDELTVVVGSVSDDRGMVGVADDVPAGPLEAAGHVRVRAAGAAPPPAAPPRARGRAPAARAGGGGGEPALAVKGAHDLLWIDDLRLQLDDQQRARGDMPGQDVNHAALPIDGERHLRRELPAADPLEKLRHALVHCRVAPVHEPVPLHAPPPWHEVEADLERRGDLVERRQRHLGCEPALDPGNRRAGDAGRGCHVVLAPALAQPNSAADDPEALEVHGPHLDRA